MSKYNYIRVGEVSEQIRGVSYTPSDSRDKFEDGFIPILRAHNIQEDGLNDDNLVYVNSSKVNRKQHLLKGDIVICASSGSKALVGKAAQVKENKCFSFGAFCKVIRPKGINAEFLGHFFRSTRYRNEITALSSGTNINNIKNEHLDGLSIPLPPLEEQKKIAATLDAVSDLIRLRKRQLEELDLLVKARFVEMFEGKYPTIKVGDVFRTTSGGTPSKAHPEYYDDGKIPWLTSGEVNAGIIDTVKGFITEMGMRNSSAKLVPINSIVIAMYGATAGQVGLLRIESTTNQAICSILPNNCYDPMYIYYAIKSKKDWMINQCVGGAQPNISQGVIRRMEVIDAPKIKQSEFSAFAETADKTKVKMLQGYETLDKCRKTLIHKYFG